MAISHQEITSYDHQNTQSSAYEYASYYDKLSTLENIRIKLLHLVHTNLW